MAPRSDRNYCRGIPVALLPLLPSQDPPTPPPRPASAPPVDPPAFPMASLLPPTTQQPSLPRRKFNFSFLPVVAPMTSASSASATPESSAPSSPILHSQQGPADSIPTITSALPTPEATPETTALALDPPHDASSEPLPPSTHSSPVFARVQPPSPEHSLVPTFPGTALTPPTTPQHTLLSLGFPNPQSIDTSEPPDPLIASQQCKPITYFQTSSTTSSALQAAS
jgi:hypothetical protein